MNKESKLSSAGLKENLSYDPETGIFRWIKDFARTGHVAGSSDKNGYVLIRVDGFLYLAHRLAWLYVHGKWPDGPLDHKNGAPMDNRISNLRVVDWSQNAINRPTRSDNTSGKKGISWDPQCGKWRARIGQNGKRISLGRFETLEQAHVAYATAAKIHHGEFARAE